MLKKPLLISQIIMVGVFIGMAIFCVASNALDNSLPGQRKYWFALVLLLYAALRARRIFKAWKELKSGETIL
jgi:hypothetical protein